MGKEYSAKTRMTYRNEKSCSRVPFHSMNDDGKRDKEG
jgi:hypothetical protein